MTLLASAESLLGSLWAVGLGTVLGYLAGHVFPIGYIKGLFEKR
jgi:hypothetical protein